MNQQASLNDNVWDGSGGCYAFMVPNPESVRLLADLMETVGSPMDSGTLRDLHCTLMYSTKTPDQPPSEMCLMNIEAVIDRFGYWGGHDDAGYIVAVLKSSPLQNLHDVYRRCGCQHSFANYLPHITLRTNVDATQAKEVVAALSALPRPLGNVVLRGPYNRNLVKDWEPGR